MAGAARGAPSERSAEVRRRLSTVDASCVCVAGTALGAPQSHFARQAHHLEHLSLSLILRGRCSTRSTSREVRRSPVTIAIESCGRQLRLCGRHSTWSTSVSFRAAGASHAHHLGHLSLSLILRGRCSTRSTSREVRRSPVTIAIESCGRRLRLRGKRSTWSTSVSFCLAGAAREAPLSLFARQAQHLEHLGLILRGRRSTWSTSVSFCVAGAALEPS